MNDKQLNRAREELRAEAMRKGYGFAGGFKNEAPKDFVLKQKELDCIDMINSLLCYCYPALTDAEKVLQCEETQLFNHLLEYLQAFGYGKLKRLIQGQIDSIKTIEHNVYTGEEGCAYNSIVWND